MVKGSGSMAPVPSSDHRGVDQLQEMFLLQDRHVDEERNDQEYERRDQRQSNVVKLHPDIWSE